MINKKLIYSLVFFCLTGCSWGSTLFHSKGNSDELTSGIYYFQQSNFIKAKSVFLHLIDTRIGSPEIEEAQWYLALISEKLDKPNIARQKVKSFIGSFPSSSHRREAEDKLALLDKKGLSVPVEQMDQSIKRDDEGKEVVQIAPTLSAPQSDDLARGIQFYQHSEYSQAKSVFYRLIQSSNGSPMVEEAYWYLALISEKTDPGLIVIENFKRFIRSYPSSTHNKEAQEKIASFSGSQAPSNLKEQGEGDRKESQSRRAPLRSGPDRISGSFITEYLYDEQLSPSPSINTQSRLSEFLDLRWRKGSGPDLRINFSGMNANDFLVDRNDRTRLSKFYLEGNNVGGFSNFRIGRQPSSGSTLFNRYDGLSFSLPLYSLVWTNNLGVPVNIFEKDPLAIESERKFYETYLSVIDYQHMTGKVFFTQEYFNNFSTRKAAGFNGFWVYDTLNIAMLFDRDIDFNENNDEMVSVDYGHSNAHYSAMVEYRRNPFLDFGMALTDSYSISNQITSLDILQQTKTREEIMQMALNNTQTSLDYNLGLSLDLSSIWRVDLRYGKTFYNSPNPSVIPDKTLDRYSIFILERNFLNLNEIASTLFLYSPGTDSTNSSIVANLLRIWPNGFQGGLRFRYENTQFNLFGNSTLTRVVPGFVMRYSLKSGVEASLECDYVIEENSISPDPNNSIQTRTSLSIPF